MTWFCNLFVQKYGPTVLLALLPPPGLNRVAWVIPISVPLVLGFD